MQETLVPSPGQEDPLEKEMATHSSIPAWEILWTEEPATIHGVTKELDTTEVLNHNKNTHTHILQQSPQGIKYISHIL